MTTTSKNMKLFMPKWLRSLAVIPCHPSPSWFALVHMPFKWQKSAFLYRRSITK